MKNSPVKFAHAALSAIVVLCFLATAIGQTDSCSQIVGGAVGFLAGSPDFRLSQFCNTAPADLVGHFGTNDVTCRNCFPGNANYGPKSLHSWLCDSSHVPSCPCILPALASRIQRDKGSL